MDLDLNDLIEDEPRQGRAEGTHRRAWPGLGLPSTPKPTVSNNPLSQRCCRREVQGEREECKGGENLSATIRVKHDSATTKL